MRLARAPMLTAEPVDFAPPPIVISNQPGPLIPWRALWEGRELLGFLAWRDIQVRYRQTLLGVVWAILEPLVSVLLFVLVFNRLAGFSSGQTPYAVHCYVAMLVWTFFARALRAATVSLVANSGLVTKAYFPRLVLPLAAQAATLVDLACALVLGGALLAWYGLAPGWAALTLPLWLGLAWLQALGLGLLLAAVNVRFRDVSQALPFLTQIWLLATPVAYPLSAVPARWQAWYLLNPMAGVVEGMRFALLPGHAWPGLALVTSGAVGALMLLIGLRYFHATEQRFADIV